MATAILMLFVVILSVVVAPWIGSVNQYKLHPTDLMAGDEGED